MRPPASRHRFPWVLSPAVGAAALALFSTLTASAQFAGSENFSAALGSNWNPVSYTDTSWDTRSLVQSPSGGGRLDWTAAVGSGSGSRSTQALLTWSANTGSYTSDWTVMLDVANSYAPQSASEGADLGLLLWNSADPANSLKLVLAQTKFGTPSNVFHSFFLAPSSVFGLGNSAEGIGATGALAISFDSAAKVLGAFYDTGGGWVQIGSYGIAGAGGATATGNWNMNSGSTFTVGILAIAEIYADGEPLTVAANAIHADNFGFSASAIPAPSTSAGLAGVAALAVAGWLRRPRKSPPVAAGRA